MTLRNIYNIVLTEEDYEKLMLLAHREYRDLKSMAAVLIRDGLKRAEQVEKRRAKVKPLR